MSLAKAIPARLAEGVTVAFLLTGIALGAAHPQGAGPITRAAPGNEVGRALVVGRVTNNPRKEYANVKLFADFLASRLRAQGIVTSRVQFAEDNATMVALLRAGFVDLIPESVFSALLYAEEAGAKLLLREWRDGVSDYHSILFTRQDNGITALTDLRGKKIAFEDPGSTTAYFVPHADLQAAGLKLVELSGLDQTPPPDAVGYVFAGSENNIAAWVHQGRVDAGAFSSVDWNQDEDIPPDFREDFTIFHRSEPLPRHVVVVRGDLPPAFEQQLKRVLLTAHEDPEGKAILTEYKGVARYDELSGEAAAGVAAAQRLLQAAR